MRLAVNCLELLKVNFISSVLAIEETAVKCENFIVPAYPLVTPYGPLINHLSFTKPSPTIKNVSDLTTLFECAFTELGFFNNQNSLHGEVHRFSIYSGPLLTLVRQEFWPQFNFDYK